MWIWLLCSTSYECLSECEDEKIWVEDSLTHLGVCEYCSDIYGGIYRRGTNSCVDECWDNETLNDDETICECNTYYEIEDEVDDICIQ